MRYLLILLLGLPVLTIANEPEKKIESPHTGALKLVLDTQEHAIADLDCPDRESWWLDTKTREWLVQRPFAPGAIDSTRLFTVCYKIDGQVVAEWLVDTKAKTVRRKSEPNKSVQHNAGSRPPSDDSTASKLRPRSARVAD